MDCITEPDSCDDDSFGSGIGTNASTVCSEFPPETIQTRARTLRKNMPRRNSNHPRIRASAEQADGPVTPRPCKPWLCRLSARQPRVFFLVLFHAWLALVSCSTKPGRPEGKKFADNSVQTYVSTFCQSEKTQLKAAKENLPDHQGLESHLETATDCGLNEERLNAA